jgi:hypothetical protein
LLKISDQWSLIKRRINRGRRWLMRRRWTGSSWWGWSALLGLRVCLVERERAGDEYYEGDDQLHFEAHGEDKGVEVEGIPGSVQQLLIRIKGGVRNS